MATNEELTNYYTNLSEEQTRLDGFSLEKLRTKELIGRHISDKPLEILDIGGASGVYAFWLSELGHQVTLLDPVPLHVEQARQLSQASISPLKGMVIGDARELAFADNSFDAALMLGPLYHLTEESDRLRSLSEAYRVLKPGGLLFAVSISQFASMLNCFHYELYKDPQFVSMMQRDLQDGQHRPPSSSHFMNTIFHKPDWLKNEVIAAQFEIEGFYAVESFASYLPNLEPFQNNENQLELLLQTIKTVESEESLLGLTCHNLAVGKKPN